MHKRLPTYLILFFAVLLAAYPTLNASDRLKVINRHGRPVPSVYDGTVPDPKVIYELEAARTKSAAPNCSLLKTVYHPSDHGARFLPVLGESCAGHYMVDEYRTCTYCGGQEDWTYVDYFLESEWCIGYEFHYESCLTQNCRDQSTCWNVASCP